jgi:hypothetical protein
MILVLILSLAFGLFFSYTCHRRLNGQEATLATLSIRKEEAHMADLFDKSLMLYALALPAFLVLAGLF